MIDLMLIAPVRAYREALTMALSGRGDFSVVSHASSFAEAVSLITPHQPRVTLLDFTLVDFLGVLRSAQRMAPATLLVGFGIQSNRDHEELVVRAAEEGVAAFVEVDQPMDDIAEAVLLALSGQSSCSPRIAAWLLNAMRTRPEPPRSPLLPPDSLTPRERIVAELVARGLTNRQIAARLVVAESTVKTHVHSILTKLGLPRRGEISATLTARHIA